MGGIEREVVVDLAVEVAVLPGQNYGAGRRTNRVGDAGIVEDHSFFGDAVDVGRLDQFIAVRADGLVGVVVRHDEQDIRWTIPGLFLIASAASRHKQGE